MGEMYLVTGAFRPALESAFREAFARLRQDHPLAPLAVIAPSKRLADRLKELALEAIPEGVAAVRFFNLFSFARTIYEEKAGAGYTLILDKLLPERLLLAILKRHFAAERYLQLSFAVLPLVIFTGDRRKMGEFVSPTWLQGLAWMVAVAIAVLNAWLLYQTFV